MTDMIERLAKAICNSCVGGVPHPAIEDRWEEYIPEAVAALKALREPTVAMLMAGRIQTLADCMGEHMGPHTERTFQAMIVNALKESGGIKA